MNLIEIIKEQTEILFWNVQNSIDTVPDEKMNAMLYDAPVWWYIFHTLRSLDKWFSYDAVCTQNIDGDKELTRNELNQYFQDIQKKVYGYLEILTDEMLSENPEGCPYPRLALILGQYRHAMLHVGNLSGAMVYEIGKFPLYVGLDTKFPAENESKYY